jgi:hypothetical protein
MWLAAMCAELGHRDEAQALVDGIARDDFAALPRDANWHAICELADACADLGDAPHADRLYEHLLPHAHLFPVMARAIGCYGSAEYFLGRLAATCGRLEDAVGHLARAADVQDRLGMRPRASLARLRLAEVLVDHGVAGEDAHRLLAAATAPSRPGRSDAAELASAALEGFRDLAADRWCRRAERLLSRLGRRVPGRPPGRAG